MGWRDRIPSLRWPQRKAVRQQRAFAAAQMSNLLSEWKTSKKQIDEDIRMGGAALRTRARETTQNNGIARKYMNILKTNVVGDKGIRLQARSVNNKGKLDIVANDLLEAAWREFSEAIDVTGRISMIEGQELFITTAPRDGEVLVREVLGYPNKWAYAIQFIDAALLDEQFNDDLKNGNKIRMGIEYDKWRKAVAFHFNQPSATSGSYYASGIYRLRVEASEIIHAYRSEYAVQSRGFSWMCAALVEMHHTDKFREAAIIAARLGASTMGFFTETTPEGVERVGDGKDGDDLVMEATPGMFKRLPRDVSFEKFESNYPSEMVDSFVKRQLKSIASGLNVSYNSLASDPEGVSYGTLRSFTIEERDYFRTLQNWLAQSMLDRIYRSWLKQALLTGAINLPASRYEKLLKIRWQGRGWQWLDPVKDAVSFEKKLKMKLTSPSIIAGEAGYDYDEICQQIAADKETRERHGLKDESEEENVKKIEKK